MISIRFDRPAKAIINIDALKHNLNVIRKYSGHSQVMVVVKSNAYGHGLEQIAKSIEPGTDAFAVSCVNEALQLKSIGITRPITVLQGFTDHKELDKCMEHKFIPVVHCEHQLKILKTYSDAGKLSIWLKIDTGMGRLGFLPVEFEEAYADLKKNNCINKIHFFSHLSDSDDLKSKKNQQQVEEFISAIRKINAKDSLCSLMNSGGIIQFEEESLDWVRPGIMFYGVSPILNKTSVDFGLKNAMEFVSRVIAIKNLQQGQTVGYGSTYLVRKNMRVAVIAAGYGDGYPRHIKDGYVLINREKFSIIGRVSMDSIVIDLNSSLVVSVGDEAVLWGKDLPVEEVAKRADTIAYELLCGVSSVNHIYR